MNINKNKIEVDEIFQFDKLSWLHDGKKIFFCSTDSLKDDFATIANNSQKAILITGNSDYGVTEQIASVMPDNIHHWFCTNNLANNDKITSIPLGVSSSKDILLSKLSSRSDDKIEGLVYANFTVHTNWNWRRCVARACHESEFINHNRYHIEPSEFYSKILSHKMVVCPLGNAPQGQADNHRIYETLYCNRVPIVFSTDQNILYESIYSKLPVIMIDGVEDLYNKDKILKMYEEVKDKPTDMIKYSFWKNKILQKVDEI